MDIGEQDDCPSDGNCRDIEYLGTVRPAFLTVLGKASRRSGDLRPHGAVRFYVYRRGCHRDGHDSRSIAKIAGAEASVYREIIRNKGESR